MMRNGTNTSFDALKQIDAGVLDVGYVEAGKGDGPAVLLLHGCPMIFTAMSTLRLCLHRRVITGGVGHNLPQEAPQAFAQAVVDV